MGLFDSLATVIRQAAVLLEIPDALRGRVSAMYSIAATGGPSLGDLNIGWLASIRDYRATEAPPAAQREVHRAPG